MGITTGYAVATTYTEYAEGIVEFPEGKTWGDVEDWFVKWDILHVRFKGAESWDELALNSSGDSEWKNPDSVKVLALDEDGYADWGAEPLAEVD